MCICICVYAHTHAYLHFKTHTEFECFSIPQAPGGHLTVVVLLRYKYTSICTHAHILPMSSENAFCPAFHRDCYVSMHAHKYVCMHNALTHRHMCTHTHTHNTQAALNDARYRKRLAGTSLGWFCFDVCFFGITIFLPHVIHAVIDSEDRGRVSTCVCVWVCLYMMTSYFLRMTFMLPLTLKSEHLYVCM